MALAFNKFQSFVEALAEKKHDLSSDILKIMLTNVAPVPTNVVKAEITEIAAVNGYPAGGIVTPVLLSSQTAGVYKLVLVDSQLIATGGSIGPFQYAVLVNFTASLLIGWWDRGSPLTLVDGAAVSFDSDQVNGILQLS